MRGVVIDREKSRKEMVERRGEERRKDVDDAGCH